MFLYLYHVADVELFGKIYGMDKSEMRGFLESDKKIEMALFTKEILEALPSKFLEAMLAAYNKRAMIAVGGKGKEVSDVFYLLVNIDGFEGLRDACDRLAPEQRPQGNFFEAKALLAANAAQCASESAFAYDEWGKPWTRLTMKAIWRSMEKGYHGRWLTMKIMAVTAASVLPHPTRICVPVIAFALLHGMASANPGVEDTRLKHSLTTQACTKPEVGKKGSTNDDHGITGRQAAKESNGPNDIVFPLHSQSRIREMLSSIPSSTTTSPSSSTSSSCSSTTTTNDASSSSNSSSSPSSSSS